MDLDAKILKQVEFYFSNSNLPNDKFLRGLTEKEDGWVLIATIASFKMMKSLTEDLSVVVGAIRKSKALLEVNEEGTKLKRKEPLPENVDITPSSLYVKGFPQDHTLDQINEYFSKHLEEKESILSTRLRRMKDRTFKGSIFIEFNSVDTATRVCGLEIKAPATEGEGEPMIVKMKADYLKQKKAELAEKRSKKAEGKKRNRGDDAKIEGTETKQEEFKKDIVADAVVKVTDLPDECMREDIKALFESVGCDVAFTEFNKGNEVGYVRLSEASEVKATAAVAAMVEKKSTLKDKVPELLVLEGEAEQDYWTKVFDAQQNKKNGRKGYNKRQRRN